MIQELIGTAVLETIYMVFVGAFFALLIGTPIGIIFYITQKDGIAENQLVHQVLGFIVNVTRSIPYVILMILMIPLTRMLIGTTVGTTATIFSLAASAAPFFSRLVEAALQEVDSGVLEAAKAMGSTNWDIIFRVLIPEALPSLISATTTTIINIVGYTAMAGSLGGGGLGAVAVRYGLYRRENGILLITVVLIVLMVQIIQFIGSRFAAKINKK